MDFAQMSAAEIAACQDRSCRGWTLPLERCPYPSFRAVACGTPRSIRARRCGSALAHRRHADPAALSRGQEMQPPLVVLADISGSMSQYTPHLSAFPACADRETQAPRAYLPVRHAADQRYAARCATRTRTRRSTNAPPLSADWSGYAHRRNASRNSTGSGGVACLGRARSCSSSPMGWSGRAWNFCETEMDGLPHRSCRRLIWLNPLLRFDGFEPRARGDACHAAHVDEFRPVRNLLSLGRPRVGAQLRSRRRLIHAPFFLAKLLEARHDKATESLDPLMIAEGWWPLPAATWRSRKP